ncbi:hypothetical protein DFH28DRAFT_923066 [Melampsora americana]|nr:hypothetical protein DFH28DRAFT_923066 [Melampsora americana]
MTRSSVDSMFSSMENSRDEQSNFSSNPTLETIKVQEVNKSTSTLNHFKLNKRYLKLWNSHSKEEAEAEEAEEEEVIQNLNKKRNKISKSISNLPLQPLFKKTWKQRPKSTLASPRMSYDSAYTTIEYTDSIRNSTGSELSFRCRGLVYSTDEDQDWNGCIHGIKDLESCLFCRVDDWVRIEDEDLLTSCDLSNQSLQD